MSNDHTPRRGHRAFASAALLAAALPAYAQHDPAAHAPAATDQVEPMRMGDMMLENPLNKLVLLDRLELHDATGSDPLTWDLDAWIGRDLNKLWIRSEGERRNDVTEHAEVEVLWGKSFARWWDFVAGARYDSQPSPQQSWAAFGVRGTAPYRFDVEATAYVSDGGHAALRFETQYDVLITNRLVLQPQLELNWYAESDAARGIGAGLAEGELGLRLRYEFRREVAPYIGLVRARTFGRTSDLTTNETDDTRLVAGIRLWF